MAIKYLINIGINDDLRTVIKKCNQNFRLAISQQSKQSQIIDRDTIAEIGQSIENIIDDYTSAIEGEAETRAGVDEDIIDNIIPEAIAEAIASVYRYKGSVYDASQLPSSGMQVGDVYNIETASIYGGAGMNVAWNGSDWDPLGEGIPFSGDYNDLENKPTLNGITIQGNKVSADYDIMTLTNAEIDTIVAS